MPFALLGLALLIAILDWVAVWRGWWKIEWIAKPLVILALLAWLWQHTGFQGAALWFALGAAGCLSGDIFLLPRRTNFLAGLLAFLIGYLLYAIGFNPSPPPLNAASLALLALVAFPGWQVYRRLTTAPLIQRARRLHAAILAYSLVISLMLLSALLTLVRPEWIAAPSLLVAGGALLLYISDIILAWNRFLSALPGGRLAVMIPYHLGQLSLFLGIIFQFTA